MTDTTRDWSRPALFTTREFVADAIRAGAHGGALDYLDRMAGYRDAVAAGAAALLRSGQPDGAARLLGRAGLPFTGQFDRERGTRTGRYASPPATEEQPRRCDCVHCAGGIA